LRSLKRGIPAPESTPTAYEVISKLIYFDPEIEVIEIKLPGRQSLFCCVPARKFYVGVEATTPTENLNL
jgi:hypothetical protein